MNGAGGTSGGIGEFFIGLVMMCAGFYMLFNSIMVHSTFGMGMRLYGFNAFGSQFGITTGMVLVPFIFGIGMVFYNVKNWIGWILVIGSLSALVIGVIASIQVRMRPMSSFELIVILVLSIGGLGLFLRSFRTH